MTMPKNLLLVRHGESEGNVANARSRQGDDSDFQREFLDRHSSGFRLTDKGQEQARIAGDWIKENIGTDFFRYYASEYTRAIETAYLLNLPDENWFVDFYLRERDWGKLDVMTDHQRKLLYAQELHQREIDRFYWSPPEGESMANLCRRLDRILGTLHRECSGKNVIIVCHGEVMWALRVRLERMLQGRYKELDESRHPFDRMHNCQILHYTRINQDTGEMGPYMDWMRSICPWDTRLSRNTWEKVERKTFSNEELRLLVEQHPRLIAK
jgi:NAD+ kinase